LNYQLLARLNGALPGTELHHAMNAQRVIGPRFKEPARFIKS